MRDPAIPFAPWRIPGILAGTITETRRVILPSCSIAWTFKNNFFSILHHPTVLCEVLELREERLHDITPKSMTAEGVLDWPEPFDCKNEDTYLQELYQHVWDMTQGTPWTENPAVRMIKFRRAEL